MWTFIVLVPYVKMVYWLLNGVVQWKTPLYPLDVPFVSLFQTVCELKGNEDLDYFLQWLSSIENVI